MSLSEHPPAHARATPTPPPTTTTTTTEEAGRYKAGLAEVERGDGRPVFLLTRTELKLLGIAGVSAVLIYPTLFGSESLTAVGFPGRVLLGR